MTKEEAIVMMKAGQKLTHRHFSDDEWVASNPSGTIYTLEDGVKCPPNEFWRWRTDTAWDTDWEIFEG